LTVASIREKMGANTQMESHIDPSSETSRLGKNRSPPSLLGFLKKNKQAWVDRRLIIQGYIE